MMRMAASGFHIRVISFGSVAIYFNPSPAEPG